MNSTHRTELIKAGLIEKFSPTHLEIIDQSAQHIGHPGAAGGGHFKIIISAELFKGKSSLEAHRLIYSALDHLMNTEIHALSIEIVQTYA